MDKIEIQKITERNTKRILVVEMDALKRKLLSVRAGIHKQVDIQRMMNAEDTIIAEIKRKSTLVWAEKKSGHRQVSHRRV